MRANFLLSVQQLNSVGQSKASSVAVPTSFVDTKAATEEAALIGPPDEIIRRLKAFEAVGVDHALLHDLSGSRQALRLFANEVMPEFARDYSTDRAKVA